MNIYLIGAIIYWVVSIIYVQFIISRLLKENPNILQITKNTVRIMGFIFAPVYLIFYECRNFHNFLKKIFFK